MLRESIKYRRALYMTTLLLIHMFYLSSSTLGITPLPQLKVSEDKRSLIKVNGEPFFYLADTAWELFHRTDRKQAVEYLQKRADQKFTVIQAVALAELNGINDPNMQGDLPLIDKDPTKPAVTPGNNPNNKEEYDYWDHVDYIVDEANKRGLYVAMLPSWANWAGTIKANDQKILTHQNAQAYGEFIGKRYAKKGIIWILGGDRTAKDYEDLWRTLAKGIVIGISGKENYDAALMSFHPGGEHTSSVWFHNDTWLDFNMFQTGHNTAAITKGWIEIGDDYARRPTKPVIDGEPLYEDHPIGFRKASENGFSFDAHVRQRAYWHLFAGACGFAYGNHAVWQMHAPGRRPVNGPLFYWYDVLDRPGATQMKYVRALIESRPMLSRVPDQSIVVDPLDGSDRIQATRGEDYLFVYSGSGRKFTVNMGKISGKQVKAHWYNPRNGSSTSIGTFDNTGTREFIPQFEGFGSDWILILDDASKGYKPPQI
jgi:hypothetical protein